VRHLSSDAVTGRPSTTAAVAAMSEEYQEAVSALCREIGNKLGSVAVNDCNKQQLQFADGFAVNNRVLTKRDFVPEDLSEPASRIMIMGGIHGDEYPSISIMFIGHLHIHQLGVYPGSLGNYGGLDLGIPVITLELPSAGIMPSRAQIENMRVDLNDWLSDKAPGLTESRRQGSGISAD